MVAREPPKVSEIPTFSRRALKTLGHVFHFFQGQRAIRVTAFAGNLHFLRSRILTKVTAIFFATAHDTSTRNVRTGVLLKILHKATAPSVNEKGPSSNMPTDDAQLLNWQKSQA